MNKVSTTRSRKRDQQIKDGAYDGRYKTKIVPDKKKQSVKKRIKKINPHDDFMEMCNRGI